MSYSWYGGAMRLATVTAPASASYILDAASFGNALAAGDDNLRPGNWLGYEAGHSHYNYYPPQNRDGTRSPPHYMDAGTERAQRRPAPRHNGGMNVGYLDGHVKWEKAEAHLGPLPNGWPVGDPRNTWDNR